MAVARLPDRDHNDHVAFSLFFLFLHPHETLANKQQSLALVTLYYAGTFHASKRGKMTNDEDSLLYFEEKKYWRSILTLVQKQEYFGILTLCVQ